ncbi:MAG: hypothetical protein ACE5EW_06410 [Thermoplasmata archaeon]
MVDYDNANARLSSLAIFMGGLSFVGLIFSINVMTGRPRELTTPLLVAESLNVLFLLTAIVVFLTSAVTLASAYFESGVTKEVGMRRARRLNVSGTMLTFWAISALLLVAFEFTPQGIFYAIAAILAPLVFLVARQVQRVSL